MWSFYGSWFLALEIPMGVAQFCEIFRGEASFCLEFPGIKWQIQKLQGSFSKKYVFKPPLPLSCVDFFCNSPMYDCMIFLTSLPTLSNSQGGSWDLVFSQECLTNLQLSQISPGFLLKDSPKNTD